MQSLLAHADLVDEVMPFWYELTPAPATITYDGAEDPRVIDAIRDAGVDLVPTVFGGRAGVKPRPGHVDALVGLVLANGYDGIDLDCEALAAGDRSSFSAFVQEMGVALHEHGKVLEVAVYAKTSEPGTWNGPQAQDYAAIGAVADRVQIMGYDFHWQTSRPGPIGPRPWLEEVLAFAVTVVPASKVDLGINLYGYDWVGEAGETVMWDDARARAKEHGAVRNWAADDVEPWFTYVEGDESHTVWYGDAASVAARLDLVSRNRLGGATFWRLGGEDPAVWDEVRARRSAGGARQI
jgi:spore germination protein